MRLKVSLFSFTSRIYGFCIFVIVNSSPNGLSTFKYNIRRVPQQFILSAGLAGAMFFLIGMLKSLVFQKLLLFSGLRTLATGSAAAGLAFFTGYLLREVFGLAGI